MADHARIVLSYARADGQAVADQIGRLLTDSGLSWTIDHMALESGRDWQRQFAEVLDAAEHLVLVLTKAFLKRTSGA
jgi:hypothetical protein